MGEGLALPGGGHDHVDPVGSQSNSSPAGASHDNVAILPLPRDVDLGLSIILQSNFGLAAFPDDLSKKCRGYFQYGFEITILQLFNTVSVTLVTLIIGLIKKKGG